MAVTIQQKFVHMAPRKLRLVADSVRGKTIDKAYASLTVMPRIAAQPIFHAIKSAATAAHQQDMHGNLVISAIFVDEGPALKRRILRSRGRASKMEHRMSHITVTVDHAPAKEVKATKRAAIRQTADAPQTEAAETATVDMTEGKEA